MEDHSAKPSRPKGVSFGVELEVLLKAPSTYQERKWTVEELRNKALERLKPDTAEYKRGRKFATIKEMEHPLDGDLGLVNIIKNKIFASWLSDQWKEFYRSTSEDNINKTHESADLTWYIIPDRNCAWNFTNLKMIDAPNEPKIGTVEYRHPPGSPGPETALAWIEFVTSFSLAASNTDFDVLKVPLAEELTIKALADFIRDFRTPSHEPTSLDQVLKENLDNKTGSFGIDHNPLTNGEAVAPPSDQEKAPPQPPPPPAKVLRLRNEIPRSITAILKRRSGLFLCQTPQR